MENDRCPTKLNKYTMRQIKLLRKGIPPLAWERYSEFQQRVLIECAKAKSADAMYRAICREVWFGSQLALPGLE